MYEHGITGQVTDNLSGVMEREREREREHNFIKCVPEFASYPCGNNKSLKM